METWGGGIYTGPGLADVDMSLFKNTAFPSVRNSGRSFSIC